MTERWQAKFTTAGSTYTFRDLLVADIAVSRFFSVIGTTTQTVTTGITYTDVISALAAVAVAPAITDQPDNATKTVGESVTFTVVATGEPAPTYQWRKDTVNIAGATSASYTIPSVALADAADYDVVVTNVADSVTSDAATLSVNAPVSITTQPSATNVDPGDTATLTVAATGTAPITYQWQKSQVNISGETLATLSLTEATEADEGLYRCAVTNVTGTVYSSEVRVTVSFVPGSGGEQ